MGSFANSLHVKCDDANDVAASIGNAMREAGYDTTDEEPDEGAMWGMPSALRALHVAESHNGWVGVLDSDLMNSIELAADLSRRLETYAIQFLVNDSDSWHYQLYHNGVQLDEFDSSGGMTGEFELDEIDEMPPEIAQMLSGGGLGGMQNDLEQRFREMQQQLEADMPADVRDIQQRMMSQSVTPEEMQRYAEWAQAQAQRFMGSVNDMMSGMLPSLGRPSVPESDLSAHVEKLRPLLIPDATDARVLEVLGTQAVFAERTLGEFLPLVGIQPFFANLSYRYLEECAQPELLGADVQVVAHLKFKTDAFVG